MTKANMESPTESIAQNAFSDLDVPPQLEDSLRRHRANLIQFIRNLQTAGINDMQIEESVSLMIASYREELVRTIKSMVR
ncbi:hypothetical protein [Silvibacterium acidisoli]|uniref:hypothetical protein n=1 Tax=Acidobacteriaceae bacterium ZG23-2 TaxID=2883246 RepID=UPI00406CB4F7